MKTLRRNHTIRGILLSLMMCGGLLGAIVPWLPMQINASPVSPPPCPENPEKVLICHVPPGNPENAQTLCVDPNGWDGHEHHPLDYPGPCQTPTPIVTATPTPVPSPTPTPIVTATPTPVPPPTPTPVVSPTPIPTLTPTPVLSPTPISTLTPTPVTVFRAIDVIAPRNQIVEAGQTISAVFQVINRGNIGDTYRLSLTVPPSVEVSQIPATIKLAVGEQQDISVSVKLPLTVTTRQIALTLTAVSTSEASVSDADTTDLLLPEPRPAVQLSKTANVAVVTPGEQIVYTIAYENTGNVPLQHPVITDSLPEYVRFEASSRPVQRVNDHELNIELQPVLYQRQRGTFTITVRVQEDAPVSGELVNTVRFSAEGLPQPQTAQARSTLEAPTISISKTVNRSEAEIGDLLLYTITVKNTGAGVAAALVINDDVPSAFDYVKGSSVFNGKTVSDPQWQGGRAIWTIGDLHAGEQHVLRYQMTVAIRANAGLYKNSAVVHGRNRANQPIAAGPAKASVQVSRANQTIHAELQGVVFNDHNGNGVFDAAEPGLPGIEVMLLRPLTRQSSDADGEFFFNALKPGEHAVSLDERQLPQGYQLTTAATILLRLAEGDTGFVEFGIQTDVSHATPTPLPTSTSTPTPQASPTPLPTVTPIPTPAPVPTLIPTPVPTPTPESNEEACPYIVQPGDVLSKIAAQFTGDAGNYLQIMAFNNLTSDTIRVNDALELPKRLLLPEYQLCEGLITGQIRVHAELYRNEQLRSEDRKGPLAGVEVRLSSGQSLITNHAGETLFTKVLPGEVEISVVQAGLPVGMKVIGEAAIPITISDEKTLDVTFRIVETQPYAYLEGHVFLDKNGNGYYDDADTAVEQFTALLDQRLRTHGAQGNFLFTHLEPGPVVLEINAAGTREQRTVELKGGRNSVDIPLNFPGVIVIVKEGGQAE